MKRNTWLEFIAFNYLDRKQEKAAVKPPLSGIGCCGARVALRQSLIPHNNGDYCSGSGKLWKVKNSGHCEWWGWRDQRTIDYGNEPWAVSESGGGIEKNQPGNVDLMKLQKAAWGTLGYEPVPAP